MYVLDTNSLIYFFKGMGSVAQRLLATPCQEASIPAIVLFELETGIAKSSKPARRRSQLDALLAVMPVIPFARDEARAAATIRAALETAGTPIGPLDNLIAATAVANNGVLVTRNVREFSRVPGLSVEDWYASNI